MAKSKWEKRRLKLQGKHTWKAQPGCNIFVADRGAVRFDYPRGWVIVPEPDSINLYDQQPPKDDCRLAVSYIRLPPVDPSGAPINWRELPVAELVETAMSRDPRGIHTWGDIVSQTRGELDLAWRQVGFTDPKEKREAFSRLCIGRWRVIQCLITFEFWADDAARCTPVWDTVLGSLELGVAVEDPRRGPQRPKWN